MSIPQQKIATFYRSINEKLFLCFWMCWVYLSIFFGLSLFQFLGGSSICHDISNKDKRSKKKITSHSVARKHLRAITLHVNRKLLSEICDVTVAAKFNRIKELWNYRETERHTLFFGDFLSFRLLNSKSIKSNCLPIEHDIIWIVNTGCQL